MGDNKLIDFYCSQDVDAKGGLEGCQLQVSRMQRRVGSGRVQRHRGVACVSIDGRSLNQKNLAASCQGQSADLSRSQAGDGRGERGGQSEHAVLARGRGLDKLVNRERLRSVDNLQKENEHHPLEKRGGVGKGGQVFGLAEQVGMGLGQEVDPCNLVVVSTLDRREDKAKKVLAVEEPASPENVEHVEDAQVDKRCNPALFYWPYATRCRHTSRLGRGRALSADSLAN